MSKLERILLSIASLIMTSFITFAIMFLATNDILGWIEARDEAQKIISVAKELGMYNAKNPYVSICFYTRKYSKQYCIDRKLVYAVMFKESEMCPRARNVNWNGSVDRGLMQINTIWNDTIMSDNLLDTMFAGKKEQVNAVEDFIYDIDHNIFMGCFVLKEKLSLNKGVLNGITRYNGAGYSAEQYAIRVNEIYHKICERY